MTAGIAIITYRRPDHLRNCLSAVRRYSRGDYRLIVSCDDDGDEASAAAAADFDATYICGPNRGVVWSKNRALYYFMLRTACDPIILLEDDALPVRGDWLQTWVAATQRWHHVNYSAAGTVTNETLLRGVGTPEDPHLSIRVTGQCASTSRAAIEKAGYLDPRFRGYGHGHVEWSMRQSALMHPGLTPPAGHLAVFVSIPGGIALSPSATSKSEADLARNSELFHRIRGEAPTRRAPWLDEKERAMMTEQVMAASQPSYTCPAKENGINTTSTGLPTDFDGEVYLRLHADVRKAKVDPAYHYLKYGRSEGRPYKGDRPIDRTSRLRSLFDTSGFGLEVGPSYNPLLPKSEGFNVEILDHADQDTLKKKYAGESAHRIEPVDYVSDGRPMSEVIGKTAVYDFIFASHVIEHTTDLVAFLKDCESLLKPEGKLVLAVPDRRYCFDFFRPTTSLGQILEAHLQKRTRHPAATAFDTQALSSKRDNITWTRSSRAEFQLLGDPVSAYRAMLDGVASNAYKDMHGWTFTPSTFRYHLKALAQIGLISLSEEKMELTGAFEFYVVLSRSAPPIADTYLSLLKAAAAEQRDFILPTD